MTRHRQRLLRQLLVMADLTACAVGCALAMVAWPSLTGTSHPDSAPVRSGGLIILGMLGPWAWLCQRHRCDDPHETLWAMLGRYTKLTLMGAAALTLAVLLCEQRPVPALLVLSVISAQLLTLVAGRWASLWLMRVRRSSDDHRVLIVGCGPTACAFARAIRARRDCAVRVVGHLAVPGENFTVPNGDHRGALGDLEHILDHEVVDEVVFACETPREDLLRPAIEACDVRGIDVLLTIAHSTPVRVGLVTADNAERPRLGGRGPGPLQTSLARGL